jgi:DNA replication and repair protein RecF
MALGRLQVTDLRCLQTADLILDPKFTLISGPNASGKTSLLEAIYVLGRGRSFRTRRLDDLIRRGAERFIVFGEIETTDRRVPIGVEGGSEGVRARIAGAAAASLADLALVLPVQIIDPEVHKLIEEGPNRRRRYLDWGVFHVEPNFVANWQRYHQALRQRNAALKLRHARPIVCAWDSDLIRYAGELTTTRSQYVELLGQYARSLTRSLLGMELELSYRAGWPRQLEFPEALAQSWKLDQERGSTQVGPQRAELLIHVDGVAAKDHISRGQQKLLAAALLMGQIKLFPGDSLIRPTLLLDDPAAELDNAHLMQLINEVSLQTNQLVVTTLQEDFAAFGAPGRRFQIANGKLLGD